MWKNIVQPGRPQTTICRMRIACWIPKATNTHSGYVIFNTFTMAKWMHERASMLRYTYTACLVLNNYNYTLSFITTGLVITGKLMI